MARTSRSPASEAAGLGAGATAAGSGEPGEGAGRGRGHRPLCAAPPHASSARAGRRGGLGDPERAPHPPRLLRPPLRPAPPLMARTSAGRRLPSSRARRPPPAGTPRSPPPRPRQPCSPQRAARSRSRRGRRRAANNDRGGRAAAGVDRAAAATCASPGSRGPGRGPSWLRSPRERSRPQSAAAGPATIARAAAPWAPVELTSADLGCGALRSWVPRLGFPSSGAPPPLPPIPPCLVTAPPTPLPDLRLQSRLWRSVPGPHGCHCAAGSPQLAHAGREPPGG